jgi:membrane protein YqaA with SNARE-associated domain
LLCPLLASSVLASVITGTVERDPHDDFCCPPIGADQAVSYDILFYLLFKYRLLVVVFSILKYCLIIVSSKYGPMLDVHTNYPIDASSWMAGVRREIKGLIRQNTFYPQFIVMVSGLPGFGRSSISVLYLATAWIRLRIWFCSHFCVLSQIVRYSSYRSIVPVFAEREEFSTVKVCTK